MGFPAGLQCRFVDIRAPLTSPGPLWLSLSWRRILAAIRRPWHCPVLPSNVASPAVSQCSPYLLHDLEHGHATVRRVRCARHVYSAVRLSHGCGASPDWSTSQPPFPPSLTLFDVTRARPIRSDVCYACPMKRGVSFDWASLRVMGQPPPFFFFARLPSRSPGIIRGSHTAVRVLSWLAPCALNLRPYCGLYRWRLGAQPCIPTQSDGFHAS